MASEIVFPDCCGIIVVNKFKGGHPGADPEACDTPDIVDAFLNLVERKYYGNRAGLMAILSSPQNERIGKVFVKRKWKLLQNGLDNPRTGAKLFTYFRDLNPTEQRKRRIFGE